MSSSVAELKDAANRMRVSAVEQTAAANSGHPMSSVSAAEIVSTLFFAEMKYDVKHPKHEAADRFVLSKTLLPGRPVASVRQCKVMGRFGVNKSACALTIALIVMVILFLNNMLSSSSSISLNKSTGIFGDLSYGVIIDAGSTGSRLFLYSWRSNSEQELIDINPVNDYMNQPVVKKVSPGLSTFGDKPEMAAEYIKPLLDYAAKFVEPKKHASTPVFIFATAGMRLLPLSQQNAVMSALHKNLPAMTNFQIVPSHIQVISGKWEGTYSWIAVNYMLGRFKIPPNVATPLPPSSAVVVGSQENSSPSTHSTPRPPTAGMIDMGGASAQIAFELPSNNDFTNENVQTINLGCREEDSRYLYKLFVTTFLGFGANEGAKKYEEMLLEKLRGLYETSAAGGNASSKPAIQYMRDGCLPRDFLKLVTKDDGSQFVRKGTGIWDDCVSDLANLLFHGPHVPNCPASQKCFFGGVVAPGVSLSEVELYGFSEYWFSVEDVLSLGGVYNHDEFEAKAKSFCGQSWSNIRKEAMAERYPHADDERLQTQCFKSAWIHAVLHNGFFVDEKRHHFQSTFKINGAEVQWALGAMIYQMRHFPLLANSGSDASLSKLHDRIRDSSVGWSLFYLLAIIVLLYFLYNNIVRRYYYGTNRNSLTKKSSAMPPTEFSSAKELFRDI